MWFQQRAVSGILLWEPVPFASFDLGQDTRPRMQISSKSMAQESDDSWCLRSAATEPGASVAEGDGRIHTWMHACLTHAMRTDAWTARPWQQYFGCWLIIVNFGVIVGLRWSIHLSDVRALSSAINRGRRIYCGCILPVDADVHRTCNACNEVDGGLVKLTGTI